MKLDLICQKQDENYTPRYAVEPIIKYLDKTKIQTVWCPFDNEQSWFVKLLKENGFNVIFTHLESGDDFFNMPVPPCDAIISNPPYSLKTEVLERLFKLRIPFAVLVGVVGLFESQRRFNLFKSNQFEIMYFNKRVAFFKNFDEQTPSLHPPFSSVFITSNILPKQIVFEVINNREQLTTSPQGVNQ